MVSGVGTILFAVTAILLLALIIRLYIIIHRLNTSFAKLGYVIREDAKKYFDDAAGKIIDTNEQFQASYTKIVRDGTMAALTDAGQAMETTLVSAHQDAGKVILEAREDAQRIMGAARNEATTYTNQALSQSADTIRWVMEQYIGQTYSIEEHHHLIKKLLDEYINERRS